jgi:hypothetical protein
MPHKRVTTPVAHGPLELVITTGGRDPGDAR